MRRAIRFSRIFVGKPCVPDTTASSQPAGVPASWSAKAGSPAGNLAGGQGGGRAAGQGRPTRKPARRKTRRTPVVILFPDTQVLAPGLQVFRVPVDPSPDQTSRGPPPGGALLRLEPGTYRKPVLLLQKSLKSSETSGNPPVAA